MKKPSQVSPTCEGFFAKPIVPLLAGDHRGVFDLRRHTRGFHRRLEHTDAFDFHFHHITRL